MRILMCQPEYFGIEYEINPWMNIKQKVDHQAAINQWKALQHTIMNCGAKVELIEPVPGLPDMVFTANAGLVYKNTIVLPHFKHKERQGELPYFHTWFEKAGFKFANNVEEQAPFFEGAGDALSAGKKLFVGYGFRSDREFYETEPVFDQGKLIYCELSDPYYYHIDTCFCPLNDELAIWFPPAFSPDTQKRMAAEIELIPVVDNEAKRFACNAVVLGKNVIIPSGCPELADTLTKRGFSVHQTDMNEFIKAGGACKCLTLRLD